VDETVANVLVLPLVALPPPAPTVNEYAEAKVALNAASALAPPPEFSPDTLHR
jgi:hypothetical protein